MQSLQKRMTWLLHDLDPMNTCCGHNLGMEDEYEAEAGSIVRELEAGVSLQQAVRQTFDARFWGGCLEETTRIVGLDAVLTALEAEIMRTPADVESDGAPELHRALFERFMMPIPVRHRWTYEAFMQQAPLQLEKPEPGTDAAADEDGDSLAFVDATQPYSEADLPMLHTLLFEKTMRRLPTERRVDYPAFLVQTGISPL